MGDDNEQGGEEDGYGNGDMIAVPSHKHQHPLVLIQTGKILDLTPFQAGQAWWPTKLVTIFAFGSIKPEHVEGLQQLLLNLFSRSHGQGAALLAALSRSSKEHFGAWRVAEAAPMSTDNPFPKRS